MKIVKEQHFNEPCRENIKDKKKHQSNLEHSMDSLPLGFDSNFFFFNFPKLFSWASFYNICLSGIESKFSVLNKRTLPNEGMRPKKGKGMRSKVNAFWVKPFKIHSVELMSDSLLLNLILNISTNIVRYSHNINIKALSNRGASFTINRYALLYSPLWLINCIFRRTKWIHL